MTIHISLSPDTEARLRDRAAALGKDVESFVLEAVEDKLASPVDINGPPAAQDHDLEDWLHRFDAWVAGHARLGYEVDDSREGIYAGRGE